MQFDSAQLLMLLQWMDSAFPTGAFAHSGALETYTQAEIVRTADDLARLVAVKLENAATTDLIIVHSAMSAYRDDDRALIVHLDRLCSASKIARETRESSEKIGRRMLTSILNLMDDPALTFYRDEITNGRCAGHHAVVHGLGCAALGIERRAAMLAFAYALAANQTAASLKLISIGQTQAQAVLGGAGEMLATAVDAALNRTLDDFGGFVPGIDICAMQHEHLFRRLFIWWKVVPMSKIQSFPPRVHNIKPLVIGIGGPVGSGKTTMVEKLCKAMSNDYQIAVITNNIYTKEDAAILNRLSALAPERIYGVETGACPHTAVRDDISANLDAIDLMMGRFNGDLDIIFLESGGDNLAASFSPELVEVEFYIIDVAGGEKIPRKGGPGITRSDLLIINKIDLAPYVGASLEIMESDTRRMRGDRPYLFTDLRGGTGLTSVIEWIAERLKTRADYQRA